MILNRYIFSFMLIITLPWLNAYSATPSPSALSAETSAALTYEGPQNKLVMYLHYDSRKKTYLSTYQLVNVNNKALNKGQFHGCTYGGSINNIATYLQKDMKLIAVKPIRQGFVIHYVADCGAQTIWRTDVITPECTASVPATNENGNYIDVGNDPHKILFGYLEGVGASRHVTTRYLTVDDKNMIHAVTMQASSREFPKPKIICR